MSTAATGYGDVYLLTSTTDQDDFVSAGDDGADDSNLLILL